MRRPPQALAAILGLLALATAGDANAEGVPPTASAAAPKGEAQWRRVGRDELCVTHGTVEADAAGRLTVSNSEVRAVSRRGITRGAELRFTALGPTAETSLLGSGRMRRQLGLKLRAQDGCNLVYVMWRVEPKNELVVSVKSNPGQKNHSECGTRGYENIVPTHSAPIPVLRMGEPHRLRALLAERGDGLEVFVDDALVWSGALGAKALAFDGPGGIRTDNLKLVTDLFQSAEVAGAAAPATPCLPTKDD